MLLMLLTLPTLFVFVGTVLYDSEFLRGNNNRQIPTYSYVQLEHLIFARDEGRAKAQTKSKIPSQEIKANGGALLGLPASTRICFKR
jgi:hypothetical protein